MMYDYGVDLLSGVSVAAWCLGEVTKSHAMTESGLQIGRGVFIAWKRLKRFGLVPSTNESVQETNYLRAEILRTLP